MKNRNRIKRMVAVLVCAMMLAPTAAPFVRAEESVNLDIEELFGDESENTDKDKDEDKEDKDKEDPGKTDKPDNSGNTDNTGSGTGSSTGSNTRPSTGSSGTGSSGTGSSSRPSSGNSGTDNTDKTATEPEQKPETPAETDEQPQTPAAPTVSFSDVSESDWYYNDVYALAAAGVISGYPDGTFNPDGEVTNAEFLKLLVSLLCAETFTTNDYMFTDVPPDEWYSSYIATSIVYGFINIAKYGDTFGPDASISRRSVAEIVVNALKAEKGKHKTPYMDTADHNIIALYNMCIMQGELDEQTGERYFRPDTGITRAEAAAVIMRIYKYASDPEGYVKSFREEHNVKEAELL